MSKASRHLRGLDRPGWSTPMIDKFATIPISACVFAAIVAPLFIFVSPGENIMDARPEQRIFWPAVAAISVALAVQNRSRLGKLTWPPHIICLLAYLAFAGASLLWAFSPERSLIRFVQQIMIVT